MTICDVLFISSPIQASTKVFLEGFQEAPEDMRDAMADMADMVAMPRIGDSDNVFCPAVQLNIARPQLYDSSMSHIFLLTEL